MLKTADTSANLTMLDLFDVYVNILLFLQHVQGLSIELNILIALIKLHYGLSYCINNKLFMCNEYYK